MCKKEFMNFSVVAVVVVPVAAFAHFARHVFAEQRLITYTRFVATTETGTPKHIKVSH